MHIHTRYSHDSFLDKFFLLMMCKIKNINAVAITDHNTIDGAVAYKSFLEKYGINVIVGEEIFTKNGEIIGLFLTKYIPPYLDEVQTVYLIKEQNGLVYIPHPYDEKRWKTVLKPQSIQKIVSYIDLIEIHNGRNIKKEFSCRQLEIANFIDKVNVIGSDAHTFFEIGRNFMILDDFSNAEELKRNLRKSIFYIQPCIRFSHVVTIFAKIVDLLKKGDFIGIFKVFNRRFRKD